jgi:energy-converting hydrogenase A subunit R
MIDIPEEAASAAGLLPADQESAAMLDDLFWRQMDGRVSGAMLAAVRPVGGGMKLTALEGIMTAEQARGADVMYVGDSITDVQPLEAVRAWGGVSLSFNGNAYALAAAEFAAASPDAEVTAELARTFAVSGRGGVLEAVRAWPKPTEGVKPTGRERAFVGVLEEELQALAEASAALRRSVRGERVARLG